MGTRYPTPQDKNIITYCGISIFILLTMGYVISAAQVGSQTYTNGYTWTTTQISNASGTITSSGVADYSNLVNNFTTSGAGASNIWDPLATALNWAGTATKTLAFPTLVITNSVALFVYANTIGGFLGQILMIIILIWEVSIGYYILKFIAPSRLP